MYRNYFFIKKQKVVKYIKNKKKAYNQKNQLNVMMKLKTGKEVKRLHGK